MKTEGNAEKPAASELAALAARFEGMPYVRALGIRVEALTPDRVRLRVPYTDDNSNPGQVLHGGVSASTIDIGGALAALSGVPPVVSVEASTLDLSVTYLAAAIGEDVVAEANVLRRGKQIVYVEVDVRNDAGKPISRGLVTYRAADTAARPGATGRQHAARAGRVVWRAMGAKMTVGNAPVLIGAGQITQREFDPATARGPLALMTEAAGAAAADARGGARLLEGVDAIAVVNTLTWQYSNAPRLLAERVGAHPATEIYTTVGGNSPQLLVSHIAAGIVDERVRLALLAGAEAFHALRYARETGVDLGWVSGDGGEPEIVGDARVASTPCELAHGFRLPAQIYPLFENALRARAGRGVMAHSRHLGALCERLAAVAASNPHAWFRTPRGSAEITTPSHANRMIAFPYTKYMNAIIDVDQGAALLLTSASRARALGIPEDRWVYLWASADATERWFISDRRDYHTAPALRAAAKRALEAADTTIDGIRYLDLYSCFPSAVQIAGKALGIAETDARPLSVTGGLPYAGGPGNNYTMHAIATLMDRLRNDRGAVGLVTALGWYVTKHAIGIYSTAPPARPWVPLPHYDDATCPECTAPALAIDARGRGRIETYTVLHDRCGRPVTGLIVGLLQDGRRFLANTPADLPVLEGLMAAEAIGRWGRVTAGTDDLNRFDPE